jgi:peptidoglycan/LPS O-acetylase OafA/YrhL
MSRYIRSLDGIRGLGILVVIFCHYYGPSVRDLVAFAWIFVQMFFVQSGYLITKLLLEDKERSFGAYLKRFYWRRMLRIFPIYFAVVLFFTLLYLSTGNPADFPLRAPWLFTYTYNWGRFIPGFSQTDELFGPFWSLALEEQFYIIWPFVVYLLSPRQLRRLVIGLIALGPVFRLSVALIVEHLGLKNVGAITYTFTLSQFDGFAFGAAIPVFGLTERVVRPQRLAMLATGLLLLVGLSNYASLQAQGEHVHITSLGLPIGFTRNFQHIWSYSLVDATFLTIILYLISPRYDGVFNNPALVRMGKVAYGMYIVHSAIIVFVKPYARHLPLGTVLGFVATFLLIWLASELSYCHFERRFLSLKDFWVKRAMPPRAPKVNLGRVAREAEPPAGPAREGGPSGAG